MSKDFFKTVRNSIKHWYIPLIVGIIFVLVGIWTITTPISSFVALSFVFAISFLFSGIAEIVFSISNSGEIDNWGWSLTFGIITALMGFLLLIKPGLSMEVLPLYVGFTLLIRSVGAVAHSIDLKQYRIGDWGSMMFVGIIGILLAFILIWNPILAGLTVVYWVAFAFISAGAFSIYFAIRLRRLKAFLPQD